MPSPNITKVYLLNVPLENDYYHTLYFTDKDSQQEYFQSRIVKSYTDFSYQRKDKIIRIPEQYDSIYNINYVMYQNAAYGNKWFYAFVTDLEYINDGRTDLHIETDVIQTWLFDYTIKPSFIEREHVSNDTVGLHTVPENLETGEYINQPLSNEEFIQFNNMDSDYKVVMAVSEVGLDLTIPNGEQKYNGVYSALLYLTFPTYTDAQKYIRAIQKKKTSDVVYAAFMVPQVMVSQTEFFNVTSDYITFQMGYVPYSSNAKDISSPYIYDNQIIDNNYVPRNKKLLTYPYRYFLVSNNAGSAHEYKYEFFKKQSNKCQFYIRGAIAPGCAIKLFPGNYLNASDPSHTDYNWLESLDAAKLPTCGWNGDPFTNWLTQNAVNIPMNIGTATINGATSGMVAGPKGAAIGAAAGAISAIAGTVAQVYEKSLMPKTAEGGVNQGDLIFAQKDFFYVAKKTIRKEFAEIIDQYFDMFGYQVNTVKTPNVAHRSRYWYTKTLEVNIDGDIPQSDMQKIKNCYNQGITFWRNANEIQNYSLSNNIV